MKEHAKYITHEGSTHEVLPSDGKYFSLKELQTFVGGYIEMLELADGRLMFLNEEGKLKRLPVNPIACELALGSGIALNDYIVGNVLVTPREYIEE